MPINNRGILSTKKADGRAPIPHRYRVRASGADEKVPTGKGPALSFHHVIPWNVMRDVWNYLVTTESWNAIDYYLQSIGQNNVVQVIQHLKAGDLPIELGRELEQNLTWPAWNLVQGPTRRYDDPDDQLENFTVDAEYDFSPVPEAPYLATTEVVGQALMLLMNDLQRIEVAAAIGPMEKARSKARQVAGLPPSSQAKPDAKKPPPITIPMPDMKNSVHRVRTAFLVFGPVLCTVTMPLLYREKMWVSQGGYHAISGSRPSIERKTPNAPPPPSKSTFLTPQCGTCHRKFFAPNPNATKPASDLEMKFWPDCVMCGEPRKFVV